MKIVTEYFEGGTVAMPEPASIPVPAIAEAWQRLLDGLERRREAQAAADTAERAVRDLEQEGHLAVARALVAGGEADDPLPLAREAAGVARRYSNACLAAEGMLRSALMAAVDDGRDAWLAALTADGRKGVQKLVTAARLAEEARTALAGSVGFATALAQHADGWDRAFGPRDVVNGYASQLAPAVEALGAATGLAAVELEALKTGRVHQHPRPDGLFG